MQIVGVAADAHYTELRESVPATVYVPFPRSNGDGTLDPEDSATFIIRTRASDPLSLADSLRREVHRANPEYRVAAVRTQDELIRAHSIRERLLATLSIFFGVMALVLAGIGLYGVLNYAVVQRRRELGIRIALGAPVWELACRVSVPLFRMIVIGTAIGLALGISAARYVSSLLFMVRAGDLSMLVWPCAAMIAASLLAAAAPIWRAVRIQPASLLRAE
jgi:ABC-type antimicrobial peptide transport system permease subunit